MRGPTSGSTAESSAGGSAGRSAGDIRQPTLLRMATLGDGAAEAFDAWTAWSKEVSNASRTEPRGSRDAAAPSGGAASSEEDIDDSATAATAATAVALPSEPSKTPSTRNVDISQESGETMTTFSKEQASASQTLSEMGKNYVIVWIIDNDFVRGGGNIWKALEATLRIEEEHKRAERD